MPLPLIIGGIAAIASVKGVESTFHAGVKIKDANNTMKLAKSIKESAINRYEIRNEKTTAIIDSLEQQRLEILKSFDEFSDLMEKIQGRPEFKEFTIEGVQIPECNFDDLKEVSALAAGILLGGVGAPAALIGATLGMGVFFGGIVLNFAGTKLSEKADEAYNQAKKLADEVNKVSLYLYELGDSAAGFKESLTNVEVQYRKRLNNLDHVINFSEKRMWSEFTEKERTMTKNTILLVGLLYKMCQVNLVNKEENEVNKIEIKKMINESNEALESIKEAA